MHCAICDTALITICYEGVNIHACESCGGEFLEPEQIGQIVRTREELFDEEIDREAFSATPFFGVPDEQMERQLECPACAAAMNVINYGSDSGVFVDKCGQCGGVWLDHEELEKVQAIMQKWRDAAPIQLQAIAAELESARLRAAKSTQQAFHSSRFSFVNALMNRVLDAA